MCSMYAPQELRSFGRVQARYKIKHSDLLMKASFQHKSEHLILHTYLENHILMKNELNILNEYTRHPRPYKRLYGKETNETNLKPIKSNAMD